MQIKTTKEICNSYYGLMEHQNSVQHINAERKETKWIRVEDLKEYLGLLADTLVDELYEEGMPIKNKKPYIKYFYVQDRIQDLIKEISK